MARLTKEVVLSVGFALLSLANIFFVDGTPATIVGIFGVIFFGGGAALLFFRPQGFQSTRRVSQGISRAQPIPAARPRVIRTLNEVDHAAAVSFAAVFQRFGVVVAAVEEADWFVPACAGMVTPGRPLTASDVLSAFGELSYYEPTLNASEVAPNLGAIIFEFEGIVDEVLDQLNTLARLIETDVETTIVLTDSQVQMSVGQMSAAVDMAPVLNEGVGTGYYISAYVALAELYRRNQTGFRLAFMAVDFTGYVMRIAEGSVDELNAELGLATADYDQVFWLDLPSNDLDELRSVTFEDS